MLLLVLNNAYATFLKAKLDPNMDPIQKVWDWFVQNASIRAVQSFFSTPKGPFRHVCLSGQPP